MLQLQKYLYSFTSPEEEKALMENPKVNMALFEAWNDFTDIKNKDIPDSDKLLDNIINKANIPSPQKRTPKLIIKLCIAAGVAVLITLGVFTFQHFYNPEITVYSAKGYKKELTLPDGSRVWLNADTKISYRKKFNDSIREIKLTGEAYFSVIKNHHRPFIVKTSRLNIRVLGTVFNVKSYPEDRTCETTLVIGCVTLEKKENENSKKPVILYPKQKAIFSLYNDSIKIESTNCEKTTCWKNGKLVFDNESIGSVIRKLERWYGLKVNLEPQTEDTSALNERYTLMVKDENIEEVIRLLQLTSPLTFSVSSTDGSSSKLYRPVQ